MTDNEIINDLEKFNCVNCDDNCAKESDEDLKCPINLVKSALDLINRQNKENKAFGQIIKMQDDEISELRKKLLKMVKLEEDFSKERKKFDKKMLKQVKIERADAIKEFANELYSLCETEGKIGKFEINEALKNFLGIKKAKWEINCDGYYPECTNCGEEPKDRKMSKICPNCGAEMENGEDER